MKYTQFIIISVLFLTFSCQNSENSLSEEKTTLLEEGYWQGSLNIQGYDLLFDFSVDENQKWIIYNDEEIVPLNTVEKKQDNYQITFVTYPNYFNFNIDSLGNLSGYFYNPDIGEASQLDFTARYVGKEKAEQRKTESTFTVDGNWRTLFRPGADNEYPAVGKFTQNENEVRGTFLKRSGDSRFLKGMMDKDSLILTSFDGSHASIYLAHLKNDTLFGTLINRNEGSTSWIAFRDDNYTLGDTDEFTYLVKDTFQLQLKTMEGEDFYFPNPNYENKVVIIQIMGTWCPNCLDETVFFKELYEKYNHQGLEIISVGYERPEKFEDQVARLKRYQENTEIPYLMVLGNGLANNKASEDFSMLNRVSAFPTSIFLNRKGDVVKIKTGFSGPGTGELYEQSKKEIQNLVEELLDHE